MVKARRTAGRRANPRGGRRVGDLDRPVVTFAPESMVTDPVTGYLAEVRAIPPYAAVKRYQCPGCHQEIRPGVGHVVVVPLAEPEARRHWHGGCWQHRHRPPGR